MKCWPFVIALVVLLTPASALAAGPRPAAPPQREPIVLVRALPFPAYKGTDLERWPDPHTRVRLTVTGEDWQFSLVQRRWGWQLETAFSERREVCALAFTSVDYLAGQERALDVFAHPDAAYVQLLDELAHLQH